EAGLPGGEIGAEGGCDFVVPLRASPWIYRGGTLVIRNLGYGRLDIAFNNAGVEHTAPIIESEQADHQRVFDINVWGVLCSMKHEIPAMIKNGGGSIINTSSIAGHVGMAGAATYIASKHAVEGLTKTAALEYAKQGIRVNAVAPGGIATDMIDRFTSGQAEMREGLTQLHPIGRLGESDEIADAVMFLASDSASFITGDSLKVDGGFVAQ
ncbi:MAG: NAD(P)-dependent dehydrogenase (short-subunit alcohol dehydrogenase family), partial [Verrucomicrobiales bacterium]